MKRPEHWRWSSCNNFALDKATVAARPIQIGDVRLPLGYRAEKTLRSRRHRALSQQNENVLFQQSRNVLLKSGKLAGCETRRC